jgi:hypothetical protein
MYDYGGWLVNFGLRGTPTNAIHLETTKIWQDVYSDYPYSRPIVDYWIFAGEQGTEIYRERFTLLDLFGDVGGLMFFLYFVGEKFLPNVHFSKTIA